MNTQVHAQLTERLTCYVQDGSKTTVSMPSAVVNKYENKFGSRKGFRVALNEAVVKAAPDRADGLSRSMSVRLYLDKKPAAVATEQLRVYGLHDNDKQTRVSKAANPASRSVVELTGSDRAKKFFVCA
jgi:hypothetical protein